MNTFLIIIVLLFFPNNETTVKSITELNEKGNRKLTFVKFDRHGSAVEITHFDPSSDKMKKKMRKVQEYDSYGRKKNVMYFLFNINTGEEIPFSELVFEYEAQRAKATMFEDDSLIRYVKYIDRIGDYTVEKIFTWEMDITLSSKPDTNKALILTDTIFNDSLGREIKRINYSSAFEKPYEETYEYLSDGYVYKIVGTAKDTTFKYLYSDLQKFCQENNLEYDFENSRNHKFKVVYY